MKTKNSGGGQPKKLVGTRRISARRAQGASDALIAKEGQEALPLAADVKVAVARYLGEYPSTKMEREIEENEKELQRLTLEYLNRCPSIFRPKPGYDWKDYAVKALGDLASTLQCQLERVDFKYHEEIVKLTADLACKLTDILNDKVDREAAKNVARGRYYWPVLKARKEKYSDDHRKIVKKLCLGEFCPLDAGAARRARATPKGSVRTVELAIRYLCEVQKHRQFDYRNPYILDWSKLNLLPEAASLAPFSLSNWRQWAEWAWEALVEDYGGHPALDPILEAIGKSGIDSYKAMRAKTALAPRTAKKASEKRIREKFFGAVQTLAGEPRKPRKSDSPKS